MHATYYELSDLYLYNDLIVYKGHYTLLDVPNCPSYLVLYDCNALHSNHPGMTSRVYSNNFYLTLYYKIFHNLTPWSPSEYFNVSITPYSLYSVYHDFNIRKAMC